MRTQENTVAGGDGGLRLVLEAADGRPYKLKLQGGHQLRCTEIEFPIPPQLKWILRLGHNRHPGSVINLPSDQVPTFGDIKQRFIELFELESKRLADWAESPVGAAEEEYYTGWALALSTVSAKAEVRERQEALNLFQAYTDLDLCHFPPVVQPALL